MSKFDELYLNLTEVHNIFCYMYLMSEYHSDGKAENIIATVATEFLVFVFRDYVF